MGGSLSWVFEILKLRLDCRNLGCVLEYILVEVFVVVNQVDQLVHTWWWLRSAAFERLWADYLAIIDNQFLVE